MLRLTRQQVREIDRRSIEEYHIPGIVLMENAARAATAVAIEMSAEKSAIIVCGGGNNGGDGLAIARHLHNAGWSLIIVMANDKPHMGDALINAQIVVEMGLKTRALEDADIAINPYAHDLIIDALLGTGLEQAPRERQKWMIELMNKSRLPILSIDVPSGLDCDSGLPLGPSCVRATKTITFVAEKIGFANPVSKQYTGEIVVGDIGCMRELIYDVAGTRD